MNGYDANALEEALQLREKHGGRVTALGLGDDGSRAMRSSARSRWAPTRRCSSTIRPGSNADSAGVGGALAAAVRKIGAYDLVLCGRQASDTDGGQVLYWIAGSLGFRLRVAGGEDRGSRRAARSPCSGCRKRVITACA